MMLTISCRRFLCISLAFLNCNQAKKGKEEILYQAKLKNTIKVQ